MTDLEELRDAMIARIEAGLSGEGYSALLLKCSVCLYALSETRRAPTDEECGCLARLVVALDDLAGATDRAEAEGMN